MKENIAIFLESFSIANPLSEEQTKFILNQNIDTMELGEIGDIYNCWDEYRSWLKSKNAESVIAMVLKSKSYDWVIGLYDSATILLPYKGYKKILINPTVNEADLKNATDFEKQNTYGFFDSEFEKDYEVFQSVYSHSVWFPFMEGLRLVDIKEIVTEILALSQSDLDYLEKSTE